MPQLVGKTISGCYKDGTSYPKEGVRILGFHGLYDKEDPDSDIFRFYVVHAHPMMKHATFMVHLPYHVVDALINRKTAVWRSYQWRVISDIVPEE